VTAKTCTGPGVKIGDRCGRPAKSQRLCSGHLAQHYKHLTGKGGLSTMLTPLRPRHPSSDLAPFTVRVSRSAKAWCKAHTEEVRTTLEKLAHRKS
jgi:hypothetical protein